MAGLLKLAPRIRAKRDQILDLELDLRTIEIAKRNALTALRADRTDDNLVTYHALRSVHTVYSFGGAC